MLAAKHFNIDESRVSELAQWDERGGLMGWNCGVDSGMGFWDGILG